MKQYAGLILAMIVLLLFTAVPAQTQYQVTTPGGTVNSVPKFTGTATIGNSAITDNNGNVGIGTSSPSGALLHVVELGTNLGIKSDASLVPSAESRLSVPVDGDWSARPGLYVADEIQDNRFRIAGGQPNMKVSWTVTGIRQDAYAKANPLQVEVEKPDDEKGLYIDATVYGLPASLSLPLPPLRTKAQKD